jgi:hypothetical protein
VGTYGGGDLLRSQTLTQAIPYQTTWLAPQPSDLTSRFEYRESLRQPKELDECVRVDHRVLVSGSYEMKLRTIQGVVDPCDAPPCGDAIHCMGQVTFTDDERDPIEDLAVHVRLTCQAIEAVPIGFDLVAV